MADTATQETAEQAGKAATVFAGTAIHVADIERSVAFYRDVLGLVEGGRWGSADTFLEAMLRPENGPESPVLILVAGASASGDHTAFAGRLMFGVPNVRAVCQRIRDAGGTVDREPGDDAGQYVIAIGKDPDGITIEIIQTPAT